ncbi:tRNA (guanine-N(7)-)-methyltransferase non-catalytic subunit wuho [Rhynchophorus ferrugineus]|uniref:tRNA (guanine-N(7)-)-methyltransferase non-catalytic subunit wuho n=1 Tax=Rhynchophorus ferrugineus TaxID=354439 RepID=UPI003FCCCB97
MVLMYSNNNSIIYAFRDKLILRNVKEELTEVKVPTIKISKETKGQIKENEITCIKSSNDGLYVAVTTETKQLLIYTENFELKKDILLQKTANKICFTQDNNVLVADRNGDVLSYSLEEDIEKPTLLLGHLSVILDMVMSPCGKFIITCDRDEKIRVSCYPNSYNIISFCLGHKEFVSKLHLLKNNILLSASGDGTVRMWNYLEGKELNRIDTSNFVNSNVLNSFISEMDAEKVEVSTLPINDLQVYENGSKIILGISLYRDNKIHFYNVNNLDLTFNYLTYVAVTDDNFYYFLTDKLYVISTDVAIYHFVNNQFEMKKSGIAEENLSKHGDLFQHKNNIMLLYKRRYNNVHEYLDRKRQRLEQKENKL